MNVSRIRDVKMPERAHIGDGGIDFFMPVFNDKFWEAVEEKNPIGDCHFMGDGKIIIAPFGSFLFPSGVRVDVPLGYALMTANKSGVYTQGCLTVHPLVIDCGYQGEVYFSIYNRSSRNPTVIKEHKKIVQCVLHAISVEPVTEVADDRLFKSISDRGENGFGSTG